MSSTKIVSDHLRKEIMKSLEEKGVQKLKETPILNTDSLLNIIASGAKDFETKVGRPMTYAEMREMYG